MTGEEFIFLSKHASNQTEAQPQPVTDTERKYVYGILGITTLVSSMETNSISLNTRAEKK